ncbi:MAG: triose-phosphate isomerase [Longimicrobiales bacterium]|nr:triose-phosphate isomerase [Longimicrobiales bacterium]
MMPRIVAGNWKMNHGPSATRAFLDGLALPAAEDLPRVLLFPPALSLATAVSHPRRPARVELGVQNIHFEASGAFTGEVSAAMAREAGATLALVGHSERRHLFGESDGDAARKAAAALAVGLTPVVCVGETLEERRAGQLEAVLHRQLDAVLDALPPSASGWILAYEPVWAIGTGETATPADATQAHGVLRARVEGWAQTRSGPESPVPILYGGSVKPGNARELMQAPGVDGVLVGGASLDPADFAAIVAAGRVDRPDR